MRKDLKTIIFERIDEDPAQSYLTEIRIVEGTDITQAIKNAASEYLHTDAGKKYLDQECGCFNYGDALRAIPAEITSRHGYVVGKTITGDVQVSQNETLIPEDLMHLSYRERIGRHKT